MPTKSLLVACTSISANRLRCEQRVLPTCQDLIARSALTFALDKAGWRQAGEKNQAPPPWETLKAENKQEVVECVKRLTNSKDEERYPPLLLEEFLPGHDPVELEQQFEKWKEHVYYSAAPGREYFFALFRLDETYNETQAVGAFRALFRKRYGKTKSGGGPNWLARLNNLTVMRLCQRFPNDPIKRIRRVAELTTAGFKGCKNYLKPQTADESRVGRSDPAVSGEVDALSKRIEEISADLRNSNQREQRMMQRAIEEMSRARKKALNFFQTLFPNEEPLSY